MKDASSAAAPEQQLRRFIDKFEPKHRATIRAVREALRKRFPTANQLVYDNYNFFVIGFGPTDRPSDCFLSIAAAANGVGLCFIHGASLPDPAGMLSGAGKQTRFLRLSSADVLKEAEVVTLLNLASDRARVPLPRNGRGKLIIRSVSAKQRPRRKPEKV
jgi:hypothetical protein